MHDRPFAADPRWLHVLDVADVGGFPLGTNPATATHASYHPLGSCTSSQAIGKHGMNFCFSKRSSGLLTRGVFLSRGGAEEPGRAHGTGRDNLVLRKAEGDPAKCHVYLCRRRREPGGSVQSDSEGFVDLGLVCPRTLMHRLHKLKY